MRLSPQGLFGLALIIIVSVAGLVSLFWTPLNPLGLNLGARLKPPSMQNLFGTDEFGRDVFSRAMIGARTSLLISLLAVSFAAVMGTIVGIASGYSRGLVDRLLMLFTNSMLAFPGVLLALGIIVVMGASIPGLVLALGLSFMPSVTRVVRASVLSLRQREFIEASRVIGNSEIYTMFAHVLPNCIVPVIVISTSMFGWVILLESALSFLGVGIAPPAPTWGNMLAGGRAYLESAPWLGIAPGVCITITLLGINLFGDALRDRFDPRMNRA